ncbi:MAG: hypothetical protein AABY84_02770 [Candidatus Firestonebacteria bacterium]
MRKFFNRAFDVICFVIGSFLIAYGFLSFTLNPNINKGTDIGRYQLVADPHTPNNIVYFHLLDTITGDVWFRAKDSETKKDFFSSLHVERPYFYGFVVDKEEAILFFSLGISLVCLGFLRIYWKRTTD